MDSESLVLTDADVQQRTFVARVYGWMFLALIVTAVVAMMTASSESLVALILGNRAVFYGLIIFELLLVLLLSAAIGRMSPAVATATFFVYSAANGLTLSVIFLVFTAESLASTFFITAGTFGAMCVYGHLTRRDLTSIGNLCIMALVGVVIASVVNLFLFNQTIYWITTYVGILVFVGLTAYDAQKIKQIGARAEDGTADAQKAAIYGALILYLDFINLFFLLLRLMGRRR